MNRACLYSYVIILKRMLKGFPRFFIQLVSLLMFKLLFQRRNRKIRYEKISKILIIELGNLGDVVMATPVIARLKKYFPNADLYAVVSPLACDLVDKIVDQVVPYTSSLNLLHTKKKRTMLRHKFKTFLRLRKENFDLVVEFRSDSMSLLLAAFGRIKFRVDLSSKMVTVSFIKFVKEVLKKPYRQRYPIHEIDRKCSLLQDIGVDVPNREPELFLNDKDIKWANDIFLRYGIRNGIPKVLIHPGALWIHKRWKEVNFSSLAAMLIDKLKAQVILTGSMDEKLVINSINSDINNNAINLAGATSLMQVAALVKKCDLVICNDSVILHIAGAVGSTAIGLFGPQDFRIFGARGKDIYFLRKEFYCSPCREDICIYPDNNCMDSIKVGEVFDLAVTVLSRKYTF